MKKVVVILLVLIAAIQLYTLSSSSIKYETYQPKQEEITKNEIMPLIDDEFNEKLKQFYPDDKLIGFKYTLTEDIDSISLKIGKNEYSRSYKIKAGYGEIYIHFIGDDKFSITIKEIEVEDNTVRTSTVKTESSLAGYCPTEKELTMTSYSEFNYPQDIVFNQEITLINHTRGYVNPDSEGYSRIEEVNLDIKISFNN